MMGGEIRCRSTRDNNETETKFTARIGTTQVAVSRWKKGRHQPSTKYIVLIARATDGAVMPNDWFEIPLRRRRPRRKPVRKPRERDHVEAAQ
jgi:hypothetical protein